jgi:hypothetical protein
MPSAAGQKDSPLKKGREARGKRQERLSELVNKKNTGVQEFRSSGVQDSPEQEDLRGDRSDLIGLFNVLLVFRLIATSCKADSAVEFGRSFKIKNNLGKAGSKRN